MPGAVADLQQRDDRLALCQPEVKERHLRLEPAGAGASVDARQRGEAVPVGAATAVVPGVEVGGADNRARAGNLQQVVGADTAVVVARSGICVRIDEDAQQVGRCAREERLLGLDVNREVDGIRLQRAADQVDVAVGPLVGLAVRNYGNTGPVAEFAVDADTVRLLRHPEYQERDA